MKKTLKRVVLGEGYARTISDTRSNHLPTWICLKTDFDNSVGKFVPLPMNFMKLGITEKIRLIAEILE